MPATPSREVIRSRGWQLAVGVVLLALGFAFSGVIVELVTLWSKRADYSHGFLIVPFVGYLLWSRRAQFPPTIRRWPDPWGLPLFLAAAVVFVAADRVNIAKEWAQAFALVTALAGVVVMFCDRWRGLRWAAPGLAFLPLAFQLPDRVERQVSLKLREVATDGANFGFQTLGLPAYTEGNVIAIGETRLGIEEACSGLSMLLAFVALSAAIAVLYKSRPVLDRVMIFVSAIPIAVLCNVLRIIVTGLVYYAGWKQLGDMIVHDLAGWLMMPVALVFMWVELRILDWVIEPVETLSTGEALGLPVRRGNRPPPVNPLNIPPRPAAGSGAPPAAAGSGAPPTAAGPGPRA
ncbi:exosortase/archaeosortase family protein [Fimbriiglobus ruber]|uniref:Eight transmembrane protein EpsH n=1 Tax=Fimbriiglobus ruber TaxID=1908690 RepID=A0A225DQ20_9BACT|nr:exosortase/archaeosortase family protein [Fimbriiglobus ruber]OWK43550.1 Eight transmembrane protein EpsH [Fimbriiglobus ruber]